MHPDYTLTQTQFHNKYIAPTLEIMGFEHQGSGMYFNILLQKLFDFSSYSLEGCIVAVYRAGLKHGKEEKEAEIKKALGIN